MNIDKHYQKHKKYMQDRHWPCAPKIEFEIWEELKKKEGKRERKDNQEDSQVQQA